MNCLFQEFDFFFDHYLLKTGNRISFKGLFCVLKHYIVFIFVFVTVFAVGVAVPSLVSLPLFITW